MVRTRERCPPTSYTRHSRVELPNPENMASETHTNNYAVPDRTARTVFHLVSIFGHTKRFQACAQDIVLATRLSDRIQECKTAQVRTVRGHISRRGDPVQAVQETAEGDASRPGTRREYSLGNLQPGLILQPNLLVIKYLLDGGIIPQSNHVLSTCVDDSSWILRNRIRNTRRSRLVVAHVWVAFVPINSPSVDAGATSSHPTKEPLPREL